jgi:16S rRNA (uracil1498-N3)-methyltransferase
VRIAVYRYDRIGWTPNFDQTGSSLVPARFYCPDPPSDGIYRLKAGEAKHLSRVCRFGVGDEVEIFDGRGAATRTTIIALGNNWVDLTAAGESIPERAPQFPLVLASAVPKADRFDWLVEKATELGVGRLIPLVTERTVALPGASKISRLERTIIEASKQCGRARLMLIDPPTRWPAVVDGFGDSSRYLADPTGFPPCQLPAIRSGQPVILAVGPEGGFARAERESAVRAGWKPINLGVYTLRIESAALAGCAVLFSRAEGPLS